MAPVLLPAQGASVILTGALKKKGVLTTKALEEDQENNRVEGAQVSSRKSGVV